MNIIVTIAILLASAAFAAFPAVAGQAAPMPEAFARKLVEGINRRDLAALRALAHPASRSCMTQENSDYYRWLFWKDGSMAYTVTEPFRLTVQNRPAPGSGSRAQADRAQIPYFWPVVPTARLRLSYHPAVMSVAERIFDAVQKQGAWQLTPPCLTQSGLMEFREEATARMKQDKKLKKLWDTMHALDRQAFILLARQGMKLDGMKALEQKYHLNTAESLAFMDRAQYADMP